MKRILQVVWTGTGWDLLQPLLDHKLLPALAYLTHSGCRAQLTGLQPQVTIQLSHSILTGQPAWVHGLAHPLKVERQEQISANSVAEAEEVGLPGWLASAGRSGIWVGWPHLLPESVPDQHIVHRKFSIAGSADGDNFSLHECSVQPDEIDLDQIRPFFAESETANIPSDPMTPFLRQVLAQAASLQACATRLMQRSDWQLASVRFELGDQMVQRFGDCHPPLDEQVDPSRLLRYQHMVTGAYRLMDMMLARLIQLAGPETSVLVHSDKGTAAAAPPRDSTAPVHQRFRSSHDDRGFLVLAGEGINRRQPLFAASILDIAPTVLALTGMKPDGVHGRVLGEAFTDTQDAESFLGATAIGPLQKPSGAMISEVIEDAVAHGECLPVEQLTLADVQSETDLFIALNMMQNGAADRALKLFEQLSEANRDVRRYLLHRARCHLILSQLDQARKWANEFAASGEPDLHAHLLLGRIALLQDETDLALVHFFQAEQMKPDDSASHCQIGDAYRRAGKPEQARDAFQRALSLDPLCAAAHLGLARITLLEEDYELACDACLKALEADYRQPDAHFHLGVALAKLNKFRESIAAFEACLRLTPVKRPAHEWLASLYKLVEEGQERAAMHKALALSERA